MVFIFFIQDTMKKTGKYDENQMSIDASAIEGTTGSFFQRFVSFTDWNHDSCWKICICGTSNERIVGD